MKDAQNGEADFPDPFPSPAGGSSDRICSLFALNRKVKRDEPLFQSFLMGGFECSTHRCQSNRRLDLVAATQHDRFVVPDYQRLRETGIAVARDGVRWHLIERSSGQYDFSSVLPMLRAARGARLEVVWDLFHYGWPDDLNIFRPAFIERFANFVRAFVKLHAEVKRGSPTTI